MMSVEPMRLGAALLLLAGYAGVCMTTLRRRAAPAVSAGTDWLVVYASQTGSAELLAGRTAATLATSGLHAQAIDIATLDATTLASATRMLFIVSTYGEGDAPDSAARFCQHVMTTAPKLSQLHFAVLALGDTDYRHYCAFGRSLDDWLVTCGAQPLFSRVEVDKGAPAAIAEWQHQLSHIAGTSDAPDWEAPAYGNWRIARRELLNAGSAGAPLYRVVLAPADAGLPAWEAGDLVQIAPPSQADRPREYSIASVPGEGHIALLIRLHQRDDGSHGAASGWLCLGAAPADTVALRVRTHERFRQGADARRPMILIGNGSGLAGLRAHLKARIDAGVNENWLIYGERSAQHDAIGAAELQAWHANGALPELDLAYSRDPQRPRYVQQALLERAGDVAAWVRNGAAVYVCGSLEGMAGGVHEALTTILGAALLEQLDQQGRYRRDVY